MVYDLGIGNSVACYGVFCGVAVVHVEVWGCELAWQPGIRKEPNIGAKRTGEDLLAGECFEIKQEAVWGILMACQVCGLMVIFEAVSTVVNLPYPSLVLRPGCQYNP